VKDGRTNFSELQAELAAGQQDNLTFYAFDLLWRDSDLRKLPQMGSSMPFSLRRSERACLRSKCPRNLSQNLLIQGQIRYRPPQTFVLKFKLFKHLS
jgi:hypothetical protein